MRNINPTKNVLNYLFYLFIFFLLWQTVFLLREIFIDGEKFQYATIGIYIFEIILFTWIILNLFKIKKEIKRITALNILIFLFVLWSFLSILWSSDKYLSLFFSTQLVLGILLFALIQFSNLNFKKISIIFLVSSFLQGLLGLFQFFTQSSFSNKWLGLSAHPTWQGGVSVLENNSERWLRAYGGMHHPNILGGLLAISIILGIFLYLNFQDNKKNFWKFLILLILPINFLALLTTFSRSAWLGFILGIILIFIYFICTKQKILLKKLSFLFAIFITIFFIFIINYSELITPRFSAETRLEKKSLTERLSYIQESQNIISNHPLLGVGIGNYSNYLKNSSLIKKEVWQYQPVHNTFFLIFSELGIVGFFLFMNIIFLIFQKTLNDFKENKTEKIFILSTTIILFTIMLFDHWLWTTSFGIFLFWLLLGLYRK